MPTKPNLPSYRSAFQSVLGSLANVASYPSSYVKYGATWRFQRPAYRRERLERTCGAGQFKVRQLSASFGVFVLAHLAWQSSFTPQMALGEHSLQAQSFL